MYIRTGTAVPSMKPPELCLIWCSSSFEPVCFVEGVDPFMAQKMLGVTSALKSMEALAERLLATDVSGNLGR